MWPRRTARASIRIRGNAAGAVNRARRRALTHVEVDRREETQLRFPTFIMSACWQLSLEDGSTFTRTLIGRLGHPTRQRDSAAYGGQTLSALLGARTLQVLGLG